MIHDKLSESDLPVNVSQRLHNVKLKNFNLLEFVNPVSYGGCYQIVLVEVFGEKLQGSLIEPVDILVQ